MMRRPPLPLPPRTVVESLVVLATQPARAVPYPVEKGVLDPLLRGIFRDSAEDHAFDAFVGRWIEVAVTDIAMSRWFRMGARGPELRPALEARGHADVVVRGRLQEFVLLGARRADPDTLFFHRRLLIEGDTELGLLIKNLMYSMDYERFPFPLRFALHHASDLIEYYDP